MLPALFRGKRLQGLPQVPCPLSGKASRMTQVQERHLKAGSSFGLSLWKNPTSNPKGSKEENKALMCLSRARERPPAASLTAAIAGTSRRQSEKQSSVMNLSRPQPLSSSPFAGNLAQTPELPPLPLQVRPGLPKWGRVLKLQIRK